MKTCTRGSRDSEIYMQEHAVRDRMTGRDLRERGLIIVHFSVRSPASPWLCWKDDLEDGES